MAVSTTNYMLQSLKIVSFNCSGIETSLYEVANFCLEFDVIVLQEIWLYDFELDTLNSISNAFYGRGFSAMSSTTDTSGRPFGGMGILWRKAIDWKSVTIKSISDRVLSCMFEYCGEKLNIVNVYCPCASNDQDAIINYLDVLSTVSSCIADFPGDVVIIGDFNASYENNFLGYVSDFCEDEGLYLADCNILPASTYTYQHIARGVRSWLDHCLINENLKA
jgi:exonuclease III